jgi:hypothetical protein
MRAIAAACAACIVSGCAIWPGSDNSPPGPTVVRTAPPRNYQSTVADWFDLMTPGPTPQRRLAFGTPETSDCPLFGTGGRHQGWMIPVIYDTSPGAGTAAKTPPSGSKTSASGTAAAAKVQPASTKDGQATATLQEVKISGKGYFFWFSSDTIAAVSRRADSCPP